jgi:glyoxylase-like metal-dependent hydrolase (beta-lactamase superfamily II)
MNIPEANPLPPALPQGTEWFKRTEIQHGLWLLTEPHVVHFMRANIWFLEGPDGDLLVDTGNGLAPLAPALPQTGRPLTVFATHAHADHVGGLCEFAQVACHVRIAEALAAADPDATLAGPGYCIGDISGLIVGPPRLAGPLAMARPHGFDPARFGPRPFRVTRTLTEGETLAAGGQTFQVIHVPGHSPGCIALYNPQTRFLIAGDAIYDGALVDDLHHSDRNIYQKSLARLLDLPVKLAIAGHGDPMTGDRMRELIRAYLSPDA